MQTNTYLYFEGQCEAALEYYRDHLGAEILVLQRHGDTPGGHAPQGQGRKVLHARIRIGDAVIMASDVSRPEPRAMQSFDIALRTATADEAERAFSALADGGAVSTPLQENFFAVRYGSLKDRFGVPWAVLCEKTMPAQVS